MRAREVICTLTPMYRKSIAIVSKCTLTPASLRQVFVAYGASVRSMVGLWNGCTRRGPHEYGGQCHVAAG